MAYIKYKELTKYFNFNKIIEIDDLPEYVTDYIYSDEKILEAYKTSRDKAVFTNKRMILFDVTPFTKKKRIHIIPYKEISSATIEFDLGTSAILLSIDSGYQIRLNFVHMHADEKTRLRLLFLKMMKDHK